MESQNIFFNIKMNKKANILNIKSHKKILNKIMKKNNLNGTKRINSKKENIFTKNLINKYNKKNNN